MGRTAVVGATKKSNLGRPAYRNLRVLPFVEVGHEHFEGVDHNIVGKRIWIIDGTIHDSLSIDV